LGAEHDVASVRSGKLIGPAREFGVGTLGPPAGKESPDRDDPDHPVPEWNFLMDAMRLFHGQSPVLQKKMTISAGLHKPVVLLYP
jgi:hypothetical protein